MKELLLITKTLLKSSLGKESNKKLSFKTIILYFCVYVYIVGFFGYFSYSNLSLLIPLHFDIYYLDLFIAAVMACVCIRSVFMVLNTLYFSKDTESLLTLPIKEKNIIRAKILVIILSQYIILSVFLLPTLIIYGVLKTKAVGYYFVALFEFIILPIIPTMITTLLISIIMKFTKRVRGKDLVQYLSIILTLIIVFGIQYSSSKLGDNYTNVELGNYVYNLFDKTNKVSFIFFTKPFLVNLLVENNLRNILTNVILLLGSSLLILYLFTFLISKSYIKTITSIKEGKTKKYKGSSKEYKQKPLIKSYTSKEFKLLTRNSTFMVQCLASIIIFPIIVFCPFVFQLINAEGTGTELMEAIQVLYEFVGTTSKSLAVGLIIVAFIQLFNQASVTAISRDGDDAKLIKQYPIKPGRQILYKIMPGFLVSTVVNYLMILAMYIFFNVFAKNLELSTLPIYIYIYLLIHATILTLINNFLFIFIDLNHPKIHWTTETQVTKQNINVLVQMAIVAFEIFAFITLASIPINVHMYSIVIFAIELILSLIIVKVCNKENIFDKIN